MYHLVFNPPKSEEVASRLTEEAGGVEENMVAGLALYHRHSEALLSCYSTVTKTFNADQPIADLSAQGDMIGKERPFLFPYRLPPLFLVQCTASSAPSTALQPPTPLGWSSWDQLVVARVCRLHSWPENTIS